MGFNFKLAGYSTAEAFVEGMFKSERSQLNAFLTFVEKSGLVADSSTQILVNN